MAPQSPPTTSGLGERRLLPARFPANVGPNNGPLCLTWAGCQGARPWPRALASASTRARGPGRGVCGGRETQPTRERGLPETRTAKETEARSRYPRHPGPPSTGQELRRQPPSHGGLSVPTLQQGAWTSLLLRPSLGVSRAPMTFLSLSLLIALMSPLQRDSARRTPTQEVSQDCIHSIARKMPPHKAPLTHSRALSPF